MKSFKKCGIRNVLDQIEDSALFEYSDINRGTSSSDDEFLGFDDEDFSGFEDDSSFCYRTIYVQFDSWSDVMVASF